MYHRIAVLLFLMFPCTGYAQNEPILDPHRIIPSPERPPYIPDNVPWPPPVDKLPPVPDSVLKNVPSDVPVTKKVPVPCPSDKHWEPGLSECVDGAPNRGVTEINGIPYTEAEAIYKRHKEELESIPGVIATGLSVDGITVTVSPGHWNIPTQVEGLLVITRPPPVLRGLGHTESQTIRPLHGGVLFGTPASEARTPPQAECTMTTIVLAHGDPWLITAGHCMIPNACPQSNTPSNCPSGTPLWQCQRYATPNLLLYQPASPGALPANVMGWVQRYGVQGGTAQSPIVDVAAAALDDNTVDLDRSLATHFNKSAEMDKVLEGYGFLWGQHPLPPLGSQVFVVAGNIGNQGADVKSAHTYQYGQPEHFEIGANGGCPQVVQSHVMNQIELTMDTTADYVSGGDSGSPIVDGSGYIIGMLNAGSIPGYFAVGTPIADVQNALGYDSVYGQNTTELSASLWPTTFPAVTQGQWACTFALVKNSTSFVAQQVAIENKTVIAQQPLFGYYNPLNQWNTPYNIPPGQTALFAPCFWSGQPLPPILWILDYYGTNAVAPVRKFGYSSPGIVWSASATPSFYLATATFSGDDVVHTGGPFGTGYFSVPLTNVGVAGDVTITLDTDTGYGGLPYTLKVCELNAQAQCMASLSQTLNRHFNANESAWFLVEVKGQGQLVNLDPYYNRVYLRLRNGFSQPNGTMIGAIGLSVTTN